MYVIILYQMNVVMPPHNQSKQYSYVLNASVTAWACVLQELLVRQMLRRYAFLEFLQRDTSKRIIVRLAGNEMKQTQEN